MKALIQKSTGKLLEAQSFPDKGTMISNAVAGGYSKSDLEEREVTQEELRVLIAGHDTPEMIADRELKQLVEAKKDELATNALIADGVLVTKDGKIEKK